MTAKKQTQMKSAPKTAKQDRPLRWSLALYRDERGKLATAYCRTDGTIVPSLRARVGKAKILRHDVFTGITFREARAKLIKASGLKDAPVKEKKTNAKPVKKVAAKKTPAKEVLRRAA